MKQTMGSKNIKKLSNVVVHAALVIAATSSIGKANSVIDIDDKYDVPEDILANLDEAFEKIAVKKELANSFESIVNNLSMSDKKLVEKYFQEFSDEGVDIAQASSEVYSGCSIFGDQMSNCYTNCHANCHGACHGSRGWR